VARERMIVRSALRRNQNVRAPKPTSPNAGRRASGVRGTPFGTAFAHLMTRVWPGRGFAAEMAPILRICARVRACCGTFWDDGGTASR